ncbi:MAG: nucleotidyl transferase AbiEii/AbiGii toxin family protein [Planctomycetia bacterium]|nr:nucleotidyl transferase AbiEii/AbiGii toxin family protein [Planctomycetia bacterium]
MANIIPDSSFPSIGSTASVAATTAVVPYETQMDQDLRFAMTEGSIFFEGRGKVQESLSRIAKSLNELGIPYAVAGGMSLYLHGYRRYTEDVDIIVTKEGAKRIYAELEGRGYVRPFEKSKNLRDTQTGVKIEFLIAGRFPGDDKPKSISFPDPDTVYELKDGIRVLNLPTIVSLKLASWMTGQDRAKDLGDVQELVKTFDLPESFVDSLHPYVKEAFSDMWRKMHVSSVRYMTIWRNKWLTSEAKTIDEMIVMLREASNELEAMRAEGVVLDANDGVSDDYAYLYTENKSVADKYGMQPESEFFDDDEIDDEAPKN